jgi:hypothetical protein
LGGEQEWKRDEDQTKPINRLPEFHADSLRQNTKHAS